MRPNAFLDSGNTLFQKKTAPQRAVFFYIYVLPTCAGRAVALVRTALPAHSLTFRASLLNSIWFCITEVPTSFSSN